MSRDSIVGVLTGCRFDGPGFEPGGSKFSPLLTGSTANIASPTMGIGVYSRR